MSAIHFTQWLDRGRRVLRVLDSFDGRAAIRLLDRRIALRGLSSRQRRVLRYLGAKLAAL